MKDVEGKRRKAEGTIINRSKQLYSDGEMYVSVELSIENNHIYCGNMICFPYDYEQMKMIILKFHIRFLNNFTK
jgi:phosphoribosylpyrophosphate synthetase